MYVFLIIIFLKMLLNVVFAERFRITRFASIPDFKIQVEML